MMTRDEIIPVPARDEALAFVREYVKNGGLVRHMLCVETAMRFYAEKFGADVELWGLTGLQKPMIPVYEPTYDMRVIVGNLKASLGIQEITLSALPRILRTGPSLKLLSRQLKSIPQPQI